MKKLNVKIIAIVLVLTLLACHAAWRYSQQAVTRGDGALDFTGEQFVALGIYALGIAFVLLNRRICSQMRRMVIRLNRREPADPRDLRG